MSANPNTNITEKQASNDNVGTQSEGLGIIQLRVAISQLRKEGKIVSFENGEGGLTIVVPSMQRTSENGKTRIVYMSKVEPDA